MGRGGKGGKGGKGGSGGFAVLSFSLYLSVQYVSF